VKYDMPDGTAHLVMGLGEIGQAYYDLLKPHYPATYRLDVVPSKRDKDIPSRVDVLHVCIRYQFDFESVVRKVIDKYKPDLINVMTTVPVGSTVRLDPINAVHSTTRGLHPNLTEWLLWGKKHIGGPRAADLAQLFAGVLYEKAILHDHARTTEAIHIASNFSYAASMMAWDEIDKFLRANSVDWADYMGYEISHNAGYKKLGLHSKMRAVGYPPHGRMSGHCVKLAAELIPKDQQGPLMRRLAEYQ
jgi:hypothetical protein